MNNIIGTNGTTADLSVTEEYRLLTAEQRRVTLDILAGRTTSMELEELAARVAARGEGLDAADAETVKRVAINLHHAHLPKMVEIGVIEYDPDSHRIDP